MRPGIRGGCAYCHHIKDDCLLARQNKIVTLFCRSCAYPADTQFWDVDVSEQMLKALDEKKSVTDSG